MPPEAFQFYPAALCFHKPDKCQRQNHDDSHKDHRISGKRVPEQQRPSGKTAHFHSKLSEYLLEHRHNPCQKNSDHKRHHTDHDKGISEGAANASGDRFLSLVVSFQRGKHIVQRSRLLTNLCHFTYILRKNPRLQKCRGKRSRFLHLVIDHLKKFLFRRCLRVFFHNGNSFHH